MQSILIVGGDKRQVVLKELLVRRGHDVSIIGFDKMGLKSDVPIDADRIFLPIPYKDGKGNIKTPYGSAPITLREIAEAYPHSVYYLGRCDDAAKQVFDGAIRYIDLLSDEPFLIDNAQLTAQAAVAAAAQHMDTALCDTRCVVIGYGRIAKFLCALLHAYGADVTATARKERDLALIRTAQMRAVHTNDVGSVLADADVIWNTVPAHVLGEKEIKCIGGAVVIELASPPYGMDMAQAKTMGVSVYVEPGLPGRVFPNSAARAILCAFEREEK